MPKQTVLAIDIGGTKMAAAVVADDGAVLAQDRVATPRTNDAEALFDALVALCDAVTRTSGASAASEDHGSGPSQPTHRVATAPSGAVADVEPRAASRSKRSERSDAVGAPATPRTERGSAIAAIGVGCGGPMRYPAGIVSPLNIPAWRDFPLRDRLHARFQVPCIVDNDAKALALGEQWRGAGRGSKNMLGMVVSTGVGGGIILDGRLLHGAAGNAGHVGHMVVWPDGPPCACGARGCVEAVASGTGLARRLVLALEAGAASRLRPGATAADIADAARAGDPLAAELFRSAGECVGRGIASAAALLDLELVVIGGSIALKAWDLLGPPLLEELRISARLDFTRELKVAQAALADDAGLLGAARLALDLL